MVPRLAIRSSWFMPMPVVGDGQGLGLLVGDQPDGELGIAGG